MKRILFVALALSIVTVGIGAFVYLRHQKPPVAAKPAAPVKVEPAAVAVTVEPVTVRTIRRSAEVVGTFMGREEITISPKIGGRVAKLHYDVGDIVRPGDVLLEIEDVDYKLAVEEAQKAVESELAKLGLTELPDEDADVDDLPTVMREHWVKEKAARKLQRIESLTNKSVATQEDFDQAQADHGVAKANHQQAIMEARATLAAARHKQAMLAIAERKLADTKIVVPKPTKAEGDDVQFVVAKRMVSEGEMLQATPPTEIFRLVMDSSLKLVATVPERHVSDVKLDLAVAITVEAYPGQTFTGVVSRINPTVDPASRTFQIEVLVPNDARQLKAGSFAKATIETERDAVAPTIPEESLVTFAGVRKVFVVRDGKAYPIEVQTGAHGDHWLEVSGEITPGTQVITTGYTRLAEGTPVRIREADKTTLK